MDRAVYVFNENKVDGNKDMRDALGGKGANLAEMCSIGLPVPPGFTIGTHVCTSFDPQVGPASMLKKEVEAAIKEVESLTGKTFGGNNPLLFSVRSGARVSMPGMMDTVLNLGLNDETVEALSQLTKNSRFAWDSYRRFIQMFSDVVLGVHASYLEAALEGLKIERGITEDTALNEDDLKNLVKIYKSMILTESGVNFPQNPWEQLWMAVGAVFKSWKNPRAKKYREIHGYSDSWGTAVNVQAMVYGNMGEDSGTGVAFTRNPSNGKNYFFGEYLVNAQGEDVVAGIRTPGPINEASRNDSNQDRKSLEQLMPKVYQELAEVFHRLEKHYHNMQDVEFTIEKGKLYLLQTRNGKRTAAAALKIAVDMAKENFISKEEAVLRISPDEFGQLLHPRLDTSKKRDILGKGLPASPGGASGKICLTSEEAQKQQESGQPVILVRQETSPEDIAGMAISKGILTARGGMTSHAAVVARGMGTPCVAGCAQLVLNAKNRVIQVNGKEFKEGDFLTIDGGTGEIFEGIIPTMPPEFKEEFHILMNWADEIRSLKVRTNADNPEDSQVAMNFGAEGIGLCRTEHMFFDPERILAIREMIFAQDQDKRELALKKLLPYQKEDFKGIFTAIGEYPVNIRLLDPPLHEFLPQTDSDRAELAAALKISISEVEQRAHSLEEFNPMLGHRGCRLGVTYPEIYRMQVMAIMKAAIEVQEAENIKIHPEIMIPLVFGEKEFNQIKSDILNVIHECLEDCKKAKDFIHYKIGTMIELPRAALMAHKIAENADFFSFGTNDLTQTTLGLSRDDSGKFLPFYVEKEILEADPFVSIDQEGVGELVQLAIERGKKANHKIHVGICGEHGGDPLSIEFFQNAGLDYISCSPFRVPVARLAAAQAHLKQKEASH